MYISSVVNVLFIFDAKSAGIVDFNLALLKYKFANREDYYIKLL